MLALAFHAFAGGLKLLSLAAFMREFKLLPAK